MRIVRFFYIHISFGELFLQKFRKNTADLIITGENDRTSEIAMTRRHYPEN